jgi:phosphoadenosine phosphosulfate reductase
MSVAALRLGESPEILTSLDAPARVRWVLENVPGPHVLSSSFGAQAAVLLHMVTREKPSVPVLLADTGYLFPETYRFIDELKERLRLNLHVVQAEQSTAWFEAQHGKVWEQGLDGIERYNRLRKVEPMQQALKQLGARCWFAGLRRSQSASRANIAPLERRDGRWKAMPIYDWTDRQVFQYLEAHSLPYHPLWHRGYVSIGDWHTTRTLEEAGDVESTRFFGLKRECGLHEHPDLPEGL